MTSPHFQPEGCFALLDDSQGGASRLYTGLVQVLGCAQASELPAMLEAMRQALCARGHAVGLFAYELGADLQRIATSKQSEPLAQVLLFERCEILSAEQAEAWLEARMNQDAPAGIADLQASVSEAQFAAAIARIHAYLEAGDTYQVNYTYRLRFDTYGSPYALYRKLRASQPVPYGALIAMPDGSAVLSRSPELFVRNEAGMLTARPMKGTAEVGGDAAKLAGDPKNRAENLMIVDLLRNDLGRIAQFGSVQVPKLFEVSQFGKVLQMTSTVQARARDDVSLAEVFQALFPCGSVTGAPKRRTMQIIDELEPDARGIYTGAIGWFEAPHDGKNLGDFCLSVPIRTLVLQPPARGVRAGEMGVGAGIVHDSDAQQEFAECQLKARFLTDLKQEFELLETMHATREGCRHLERHLQRLRASANYFGFAFDEVYLREKLHSTCAQLHPQTVYRLRLALSQIGQCIIQTAPLIPLQQPVKLLLASQTTQSDDLFLRHKTTVRAKYDAAWRAAEAQGAFDTLFVNERGEVTEGARSNIFVKLRGRWLTPPLFSGLLPGIMRAVLLEESDWHAVEQAFSVDDLRRAEEVVVCNSLRGVLRAVLA